MKKLVLLAAFTGLLFASIQNTTAKMGEPEDGKKCPDIESPCCCEYGHGNCIVVDLGTIKKQYNNYD